MQGFRWIMRAYTIKSLTGDIGSHKDRVFSVELHRAQLKAHRLRGRSFSLQFLLAEVDETYLSDPSLRPRPGPPDMLGKGSSSDSVTNLFLYAGFGLKMYT